MTLVRGNVLGWAPLEELTATQMNTIDAQLPDALDGAHGGMYAPDDFIDIDTTNGGNLRWHDVAWPALAVRPVRLWQGIHPVHMSDSAGQAPWQVDAAASQDWGPSVGGLGGIAQTFVDTGGTPVIPELLLECPRVPEQAQVVGLGAMIYHAGAGSDPAVMPSFTIANMDFNPGGTPAVAPVGSPVDAPTSYRNATRLVEVPSGIGAFAFFRSQSKLMLLVTGAGGANAAAGLRVMDVYVEINASVLRY